MAAACEAGSLARQGGGKSQDHLRDTNRVGGHKKTASHKVRGGCAVMYGSVLLAFDPPVVVDEYPYQEYQTH